MIEASGNGDCLGSLTKRPCKTHYIPGSKITLERTIFKPEFLFSEITLVHGPFMGLIFWREKGKAT